MRTIRPACASFDAQHGWVLGQTDGWPSVILCTADGGQTWTFQYPNTWTPIAAITFSDASHGWAVGRNEVYRTTDGGASWTLVWKDSTPLTMVFYTTVSVSGHSVWVSGYNNTNSPLLITSSDDGATWQRVSSPPEFTASPSFTSATEGWGIADDTNHNGLIHTTDAGTTWQVQYGPLYTGPSDDRFVWLKPGISMADAQHGWAVGPLGTILRTTDGATWSNLRTSVTEENLQAVDFVDDLNGWAVGKGHLFHTTSGGWTWSREAADTDFTFNSVSFVSAKEGWAGGAYDWDAQSALMHTTDGGATWQFVPTGNDVWEYDITKVQFLDAQHGWILQDYAGQMARTTDGGATWQVLDTKGLTGTTDFTFFDAQHGWLVGEWSQDWDGTPIGKTAYTTDGGVTWTPDGVPYVNGVPAATRVSFGDTLHGYAVGGNWIQRTDDGGVSWQHVDLGAQTPPLSYEATHADFTGVVATDATHAVAVAGNGVILCTADGGVTWSEQHSGCESQVTSNQGEYYGPLLAAVTAPDATHLWAVGAGGIIISTTRATAPDVTPPTTTVSGADDLWHNTDVHLTLTATDDPGGSGVAATHYQVDGDPWLVGTSLTVPAPANHSNDGVHTVSYYSTDNAGNSETAKSCTVKIDTTSPVISVAYVGFLRHCAHTARCGRTSHFGLTYRIDDNLSPTVAVTLEALNLAGKVVKTISVGQCPTGVLQTYRLPCRLSLLFCRWRVTATDLAGNSQSKLAGFRWFVQQ